MGIGCAHSSLNKNILCCCTSSSDTIDAGLIQRHHKFVGRLIVEFVIAVEDNLVVGLELTRQVGPEGLEIRRRSEDCAIVASIVVRVENSMGASGGDV